MDVPSAKRRATRYGLADAGAADDFDRLAAAAAAGQARRRRAQEAGVGAEGAAVPSTSTSAAGDGDAEEAKGEASEDLFTGRRRLF